MKKRGFGIGRWNGYGGKIRDGESVRGAALRELGEECGVLADLPDLEYSGNINFYFAGTLKWTVHIFLVYDWEGEPQESEEMKPKWFDVNRVPYEEMWAADKIIFPYLLDGKKVSGKIFYNKEGNAVLKTDLKVSE